MNDLNSWLTPYNYYAAENIPDDEYEAYLTILPSRYDDVTKRAGIPSIRALPVLAYFVPLFRPTIDTARNPLLPSVFLIF